jgi:hypothetical protein
MRRVWMTVVCLTLSLCAATQDQTPKPKISDEPLTADQIAVYRAVLKDYTKGSQAPLNVANTTEPLDDSRPMFDDACFKEVEASLPKPSVPISHRLDHSLMPDMHLVFVDPDRQQKAIDENDPQNLVKKAVDAHERVTDAQVDQSVKHAFEAGMFTLSEIVFDKEHRRAVVAYSFACGSLCGNGNTLILTKSGKSWKVAKRCGGWVS